MRKLLIGVVAVLGLLVVAVLAVPLLVPTDPLKARLADSVRAATGRELRVDGAMRLSLVPRLSVQADDVTFANAPGGKAPEMARLKSLAIELRLRPLLRGQIEVSRLVLTDPVIALEVDRAGRGNWVFEPSRLPSPGGQPAAPRTAAGQTEIRLDDMRLVGGRVSWLDQRSNSSQVLEKIDLKLSLPGMAGPFTVEGSAVWNGEKVALSVTAAAPGALLAGGDSVLAMTLDAAPVRLRLDGTLTGLPPVKTVGTVDLAMPSLRGFAAWAGTPIALPGEGLGPLAIKGRLSRAGEETAFSDADITFDGMRGKGSLSLVTGGPRPLLKGRLELDRLDLNPYLPAPAPAAARSGGRAQPAAAAAPAGWSDAPIDFSGLKAVDAELNLAADAIHYRALRIDRTRLGLHLKDGLLAADLREVALYRGAGSGKLQVDSRGKDPALELSFALAHVQIEPLLTAAADMDRLSGAGTFNLAVSGTGASQRALIAGLNGKGTLNLADGVVKGVNLLALAQSVVPGGAKGESGDSTTFGSLNASFTIADGVLRNDDLLLKTRLAPVSGAGTVNLPARTIDYRAVAQIAGTLKVPIQIGGTFERPTYRPELGGTLEQLRGLLPGSGGGAAAPNPGNLLRNLLQR